MTRSITVLAAIAMGVLSDADEGHCKRGECGAVQGPRLLQRSLALEQDQQFDMRGDDAVDPGSKLETTNDDPDVDPEDELELGLEFIEAANPRRQPIWEKVADGVLCEMESVPSIRSPTEKYAMYGAYERRGGDRTRYDGVMHPEFFDRWSQTTCQARAKASSHKYYAWGKAANRRERCYTFVDCKKKTRNQKTRGFKLYKSPVTYSESVPGDVSAGARISCKGEEVIREGVQRLLHKSKLAGQEPTHTPANEKFKPLASVLRAVYHDAHDFNSLKSVNKTTNEWQHVVSDENYGGVDGCIYENTFAERTAGPYGFKILSSDAQGSMLYNMNIERKPQNQDFVRIDKLSYLFASQACMWLCSAKSQLAARDKEILCGTDDVNTKAYELSCMVDVTVFGSLMIIEENNGLKIPMTWGRRQSDCRNPFKNIRVHADLETKRIAQAGAGLSSFGKPEDIFEEFAGLGFNKTEATALMGGHSFGKLHYYTGGPRTRDKGGGFCADLGKVRGSFSDGKVMQPLANDGADHWNPSSTPPGNCVAFSTTAEGGLSCWTNERGYLEPARRNGSALDQLMNGPHANYIDKTGGDVEEAIQMLSSSWGGGGFWDRSPDKFDNDYFKLLAETDPQERLNCCGPSTEFGCSTDGMPMQNKEGKEIHGCDINWCLRSIGGMTRPLGGGSPTAGVVHKDYLALSTRNYVQSDLYGRPENGVHRIIRMAADWALIDDDEARRAVKRFAESESDFFEAFAAVWSKTINLGYRSGVLQTCEADRSWW